MPGVGFDDESSKEIDVTVSLFRRRRPPVSAENEASDQRQVEASAQDVGKNGLTVLQGHVTALHGSKSLLPKQSDVLNSTRLRRCRGGLNSGR